MVVAHCGVLARGGSIFRVLGLDLSPLEVGEVKVTSGVDVGAKSSLLAFVEI